jgi:DNA-binding transcriptional regulator LsrR (DeoR family)/DNA-binding Xre family transcriptional regulator
MTEPIASETARRLGKRIQELMGSTDYDKQDIARLCGMKPSTFSRVLNGTRHANIYHLQKLCEMFDCSPNDLMGTEYNTHKKISWMETPLYWMPDAQVREFQHAIQIFKHGIDGQSFADMKQNREDMRDYSIDMMHAMVSTLFRSGGVQITNVPRNEELGKKVENEFRNYNVPVIVADTNNLERVIGAELVAFLATTKALPELKYHPDVIGLGSSYTIARMCELSYPTSGHKFSGTHWLPLNSFPAENTVLQAANYIALCMANRHNKSIALYLPFMNDNTSETDLKIFDEIKEIVRGIDTAFITVNGLGQKFSSSDGRSFRLKRVEELIYQKQMENDVAGELLGLYLDRDGTVIDDEEIRQAMRSEVYQFELDMLRSTVTNGQVWLIASGAHKTEAVRMAIESGYANRLIIDSPIAKNLVNTQG